MKNIETELEQQIQAIRRFNRFYTKLAGILEDMYLGAPVRLSEARVLYEISSQPGCKAGELATELGMDPGYLSRTISCMEKAGFVRRKPDPADRRSRSLYLSQSGQALMEELSRLVVRQTQSFLEPLQPDERRKLVRAMQQIQTLLGDDTA